MHHTISVQETQVQLTDLLAWLRNGEDVILTEAGQPVARLIALTAETPASEGDHLLGLGKRRAGLNRGAFWVSEDFNEPLPDEFWLGEEEEPTQTQ